MELEFATTRDIVDELQRRNMRFIFVGTENTNSSRKDATCISAQGTSMDDVLSLVKIGEDAFLNLDEEKDE